MTGRDVAHRPRERKRLARNGEDDAKADTFSANATDGSAITVPVFESDFGNPSSPTIPEIDIKIESIAVTPRPASCALAGRRSSRRT